MDLEEWGIPILLFVVILVGSTLHMLHKEHTAVYGCAFSYHCK